MTSEIDQTPQPAHCITLSEEYPVGHGASVTSITHDDYLKLCGLLVLARQSKADLERFTKAACTITGEQDDFSHTSDAIWEGYTAEELLRKLEITVRQSEGHPSINSEAS